MTTKELAFAASTIWVVIAAVLVMFMQAGFAFLEAGLTRMKNVGHVAAKNVLIFALASIVYYLVGFGIAFGDGGNGLFGGSGFVPSVDSLLTVGQAPFSWFSEIPGAAGYLFEVVFCAVSLAIVWGAMAERTRLWVYFAFGIVFTVMYSFVSHWIWSPDGWLFAKGMQDFAGSTVVHYHGALAALVAITAACAFVAPWAAIVIGLVAGGIVVVGVLAVEKVGLDDPVGAVAAHGMSGVWGTLSLGFFTVPSLAGKLETGRGGLFYGGGLHQLGIQALGLVAVGAFTFSASFAVLWVFKRTVGIRTEPEVETAGLDVSEHGMWGYPEFYIPVPGGYGTESHGHLGLAHAHSHPAPAHAMTPVTAAVEPTA